MTSLANNVNSIGIVLRGSVLQENVTFVEIGYVKAGVEVLKKD